MNNELVVPDLGVHPRGDSSSASPLVPGTGIRTTDPIPIAAGVLPDIGASSASCLGGSVVGDKAMVRDEAGCHSVNRPAGESAEDIGEKGVDSKYPGSRKAP